MQFSEIIRLDARVVDVIAVSVFRVVLANGHRFVAYAEHGDREAARNISVGDVIRVEMSPYDMSRGRIKI